MDRAWLRALQGKAWLFLGRLRHCVVPGGELELQDIKAALKEEQEAGETSYLDCFRNTPNKILFRTLTGIFIQAWQQLTGVNFVFYCALMLFPCISSTYFAPFAQTVPTSSNRLVSRTPSLHLSPPVLSMSV